MGPAASASKAWRAVRQWRPPRSVRGAVRLVILVLIVEYLLVPQLAGTRKSWHLLVGVDDAWLAAATALEVASLAAYGLLSRAVLPPGRNLPSFWTLMRIDLATLAVSHVVPAGSAVGLGLGYRLLTQAGVRGGDAVIAKATQAVGSAVVLNIMLLVALVIAIPLHGFNAIFGTVAVIGILLLAGAAAVVVLLTRGEERGAALLGRQLGRLPGLTEQKVRNALYAVAEHVQRFTADRRLLRWTAGLAALNWLLDAAALWCCIRSFGHALGPDELLVPYGIAGVLAALPFTPAGIGIVEGFLIPALVGFGVPRGIAILGVLGWRALNFLLPIPLGALAYLSLPRPHHRDDGPAAGAAPS